MALFQIEKIYEQKPNFTETPQMITSYLERNKLKSWKKNGFKPAADFLNKENQTEFDKFCSYIRELLNKINADNYDIIICKFDTIEVETTKELETIVRLVLEKAVREDKYSAVYAKLANHLAGLIVQDSDNKEFVFKKILLSECQKFFIKITTQQNIRKADSIAFVGFLSELYNNHILATNNLSGCFDIVVAAADKNNLMVDIAIAMLSIVSQSYKKRDPDKYKNTLNKLRKLCEDPKISKRENIILAEALDKAP